MKAGKKPKDKTSPIKKKYKPPPRIFVLSAQDQYGLKRQRVSLLRWLQDPSSRFANQMKSSVSEYSYVRDLAFTLGENRSQLAWKSCSIASSRNDLCSALDDTKAHAATQRPYDNPRLGFVFTGQGAQWAQMGIELNVYPVFQESMRLSDEYLRSALKCPWSAMEEIQSEWKDSKINRRAYCQPICTILQLALVDLLASWNVVPSIVVGHSSGEIAAAYCLGCLSKEDALKIAYYRGLLSSEIGEGLLDVSGAMMAIGASEAQAQGWIDRLSCREVVVACINSPSSTTVSGDLSGIEEMQAMLTLEGVFARRLEVDIAYHSPHMDRVSGPYLEALKMVQPTDAGNGRQLFSSVTGCVADPTELGPMYWVRNLLSPVLFYDALYTMLRPIQDGQHSANNSVDLLIEIGPNSALKGPVQQILKQHELPGVEYRSTILRDNNAVQTILATVGQLFDRGVRVDIRQVNNFLSDGFDKPPQLLLDLPSYSWDHSRRFWSESRIHEEHRNRTYPHLNFLGAPYPSFGEGESIWRGFWRVSEEPWIQDHVVQGSILYPAAGYIVMAVEAAHQVATKDRVVRDFRLREVEVVAPMVLTEDSEVEIIFQLRPRDNFSSWSEFTVSSSTRGEQLQRNCHGFVNTKYMLTEDSDVVPEKAFEDESSREAYAQIEKTCQHAVDPIRFYEELESLGISYGPSLRNLAQITLAGGKSHCRVDIPNYTSHESSNPGQRPHVIHPATLDGLFHFVIAAFKAQDGGLRKALVPKSIEEITISASVPFESNSGLRGICDASKHGDRMIMSQLVVFDEKISSPAVSMKGFCWVALSPLESSQQEEQRPLARRLFSKLVWQPAPKLHEKSARHYHYTILETPNATPLSHSITTELENLLNRESFETSHTSWNHKILDWKDNHCISIIELETPFLADMTADDFVTLKRCILETSSLLWVVAVDDPRSDLILGLARVVRNEIPGKAIRTLRFQSLSSSPTRRLAEIIKDIATTSTIDNEFLEEGGTLKVCRLVEDLPMIEDMSRWTGETTDDSYPPPMKRTSKPQRLATASIGMLDTLHLEEDTILQNSLASDEVEIEVKATGLKYLYLASILSSELTLPSFRDVMVVMGQMPDELLGFDASGIIVRAGKDVTHFEIGDAVCTLGHGTHRSLLRNKANLCQPLPQNFSFEEAATLPLVHCTAFYALVHIARVQKGQSVLIHAAAGGVGQAAIQIAQHFGAEIFVTVGSVEKRRLIQEVYGVARDHIFSSRDLDFAKGVLRMTNGRGADCVLNSLSGEALQETWRCIAPFGKFIEIGMRDIMGNTRLEMRPFLQDATFTFFNLEHVMKERPELMATIMNGAFDLLRRGITKLVSPVVSYPISEVEGAFRLMQTGKHKGKIALDWSLASTNPEPEDSISPFKLDQNASYLLVGGLGGLGRSLANFLVGLGARYLCFISRSGDQSTQAKTLLQDLQKRGVQIGVYRCNIANRDLLAKGLQLCSEEMPPIKGVFQCAMALHDTVFERLTYQQWVHGLEPKVQGSWNLHVLLPQNLDFHVTLSSFVGLFGGRSQSSYSAGSVFQDALAFHRRSLGLKAVTVDLGIMRDVGRLAEHGSTDFIQEWKEPFGIREYEFHGLMKKIIVAEVANTGKTPPQIITGLPTGASAQAAGIRRPYYFDDPRFTILAETRISQKDHDSSPHISSKRAMLFEQVAKEKTLADAAKVITEALVARVAKSLQTTISEIDERQSLYTYGIDSLVAVEILDWIFKQMKVVVSVFDILATRPISDFALHLAFKSQLIREAQTSS